MPESYNPLPTESDYLAAAELCDEDFKKYGGAWVRLMSDELYITQVRVESEVERRALTASVAQSVEEGRYPYMQSTHTFARGMRAGYRMLALVHPQGIGVHELTNMFTTGVGLTKEFEGEIEKGALDMQRIGETGLDIVGEGTTQMIESWAKNMTHDTYLQRLFVRGTGTALLGGYALHVDQNFDFINSYRLQVDLNAAIDDILASDTGE
jgi:hypothetical protein